MKKYILFLGLIIGVSFHCSAQKINTVPAKNIRQLPNGWHKFLSAGATFDVEVLNGSLLKGNIIWFDGSTYSGGFHNNTLTGKGTYTWTNGDRYEGSFKGNKRQGKGTMYKKDGSKHQGKWKNNKKHGKGKAYDSSGKLIKQGNWEDGVFIEKSEK